jgi:hypothetical protein
MPTPLANRPPPSGPRKRFASVPPSLTRIALRPRTTEWTYAAGRLTASGGIEATPRFPWGELSTWRWGDAIGDSELRIIMNEPDQSEQQADGGSIFHYG